MSPHLYRYIGDANSFVILGGSSYLNSLLVKYQQLIGSYGGSKQVRTMHPDAQIFGH